MLNSKILVLFAAAAITVDGVDRTSWVSNADQVDGGGGADQVNGGGGAVDSGNGKGGGGCSAAQQERIAHRVQERIERRVEERIAQVKQKQKARCKEQKAAIREECGAADGPCDDASCPGPTETECKEIGLFTQADVDAAVAAAVAAAGGGGFTQADVDAAYAQGKSDGDASVTPEDCFTEDDHPDIWNQYFPAPRPPRANCFTFRCPHDPFSCSHDSSDPANHCTQTPSFDPSQTPPMTWKIMNNVWNGWAKECFEAVY